ncbi:MAG: DeoR/GlpR family DNA-binding transcription regulator [Thermoguttaceae bacterium]|jgi:DeoR/GlpR family transcriptional regulator of sugar metabolism
MNQTDRQAAIIKQLDSAGACSYQDLAALFGVSEMTIRRDADKLVQQRSVIKTLGGLQTAHAPGHLYESAVQQRLPLHRREKELIAVEAVRQIKPPLTVFLDGSTTCLVLARHLCREPPGMTVVTHSGLVCLEFGPAPGHTVLSLGGQFDPASACFVGPAAEESARRFFVDIAFLSTKGFLPKEGTFESSIATFRIKQLIAEQADRVVLLADHSKFGQRALCKVLDIEQIDEVITDQPPVPADLAVLQDRGVDVRIAAEMRPAEEDACHAT